MAGEHGQDVVPLPPPSSESITFVVQPRQVDAYVLTESELEALAATGYTIHTSFAGLGAGFAVAFLIVLLTASTGIADRTFAAFVALFAVSCLGTAYFAVRAVADWRSRNALVERIEGRRRR